jgi:membrane protein implicated in regulation of membrane protease activity
MALLVAIIVFLVSGGLASSVLGFVWFSSLISLLVALVCATIAYRWVKRAQKRNAL